MLADASEDEHAVVSMLFVIHEKEENDSQWIFDSFESNSSSETHESDESHATMTKVATAAPAHSCIAATSSAHQSHLCEQRLSLKGKLPLL